MRVMEAAYRTVHEASGGAAAVAEGIGMGKQVLVNKVNPNNHSHHLALEEAVRLMEFTGDTQILHAVAQEFSGIFVPLGDIPSATDNAVITDISEMSVKFGRLVQEVVEDAKDGEITSTELNRIESEAMRLRTTLGTLLSHVRAMHESAVKQRSPA